MYDFDKIIPRENTDAIKYEVRKEYFGNPDLIPMWVADMDIETPSFIVDAMQQRLNHRIYGYTLRGKDFNDSICKWNLKRNQWEIKPEWISFSPGIVPAVNMLVMAFTEPGDKILVQTPVYFPFFSAVKNHRRELVTNSLHVNGKEYTIDFETLEKQLASGVKMAILCSPHNPVARVWKKEELEAFAALCLKYNVLIISDEIHSDLIFPGHKHIPLSTLSEEIAQQTITCMAPSKTFNLAGLSTSFLVMPNKVHKRKYEKILDDVHVGAGNIFGNVALTAAYTHGGTWVDELMLYLDGTVNMMQEFFENELPQVKMVHPEGTYLVWLDFRSLNLAPKELTKFLIHEAGVGFSDGVIFGEEGAGFQRINIGCPREVVKKALKRISIALKNRNF